MILMLYHYHQSILLIYFMLMYLNFIIEIQIIIFFLYRLKLNNSLEYKIFDLV